ncbi:MAG TPA: radical SAM protein [bacterium]|jgi:hypothetical protein
MITSIHILLTYACTGECDHCFLYCGPSAKGTFTLAQLRKLFAQIRRLKGIEWVYLEGGEPFLFYPLMLEGLRLAKRQGLKTGVVSNAYWATTEKDAELWLKPLPGLGVADLSLSDDEFHCEGEDNPARRASKAARKLKLPVDSICIEKPAVTMKAGQKKGEPVIGGGVMFRGRAAEKLMEGLLTRPIEEFTSCPHEDLENPSRVHVDPYGNVHLCQGLLMGNIWETPLSKLISNYEPQRHPICGPLIDGGPLRLAQTERVRLANQFVDECHYCFSVRLALLDRYPQFLGPRQVYGLT